MYKKRAESILKGSFFYIPIKSFLIEGDMYPLNNTFVKNLNQPQPLRQLYNFLKISI